MIEEMRPFTILDLTEEAGAQSDAEEYSPLYEVLDGVRKRRQDNKEGKMEGDRQAKGM